MVLALWENKQTGPPIQPCLCPSRLHLGTASSMLSMNHSLQLSHWILWKWDRHRNIWPCFYQYWRTMWNHLRFSYSKIFWFVCCLTAHIAWDVFPLAQDLHAFTFQCLFCVFIHLASPAYSLCFLKMLCVKIHRDILLLFLFLLCNS